MSISQAEHIATPPACDDLCGGHHDAIAQQRRLLLEQIGYPAAASPMTVTCSTCTRTFVVALERAQREGGIG